MEVRYVAARPVCILTNAVCVSLRKRHMGLVLISPTLHVGSQASWTPDSQLREGRQGGPDRVGLEEAGGGWRL